MSLPPTMTGGAERAAYQPTNREMRSSLENGITAMKKREWAQYEHQPEKIFPAMLEAQGPQQIARMQKSSAHYRTLIEGGSGQPGIRSSLESAILNGPASFGIELTNIMDGIINIPEYNEDEQPKHRYLFAKTMSNRKEKDEAKRVTYFRTNFSQMDEDLETLERMKTIYPDQVAQLDALKDAIGELKRASPGHEGYDYYANKSSFTDQAFKHFGKTIGFGALALAGILFTTIAVINKKFDWKAVIALSGAALIASPDLRRMIMGGRLENDFAEVESSMNDHTIDLMDTYEMKGEVWGNLVDRIQDTSDAEVNTALEKLNTRWNPHIGDAEVEALARSLMPNTTPEENAARENLQKLMESGNFPGFVGSLRGTKTAEAKQIARDFVVAGSAKTAKAIRATEAVVEAKDAAAGSATSEVPSS